MIYVLRLGLRQIYLCLEIGYLNIVLLHVRLSPYTRVIR